MTRRLPALFVAGVIALLGACGGNGRTLDAGGAKLLAAEVGNARVAAGRGQYSEAAAAVANVANTVNALLAQHRISRAQADRILAAVDTVNRALASFTTTTTPPTTLTPATTAPPPGRHHRKQHGNENSGD
jgi:hypothetical protein